MTLLAFETADPGVMAVASDGTTINPSPGIALLDGPTLIVGRRAAKQTRLLPRRIYDRFWDRLDDEPLDKPHPGHLTPADLVHAHLSEVGSDMDSPIEGALLAVPGHFDRRQLGVLLGVMEACEIPARGMVDAAVAAVAFNRPPAGLVLHIDILLHRTVVTWLSVGGDVERRRVESEDGIGLTGFRDVWARHIAHQFIRATRFDPLKLANTEQELYDRLPELLSRLVTSPETEFGMSAGGREYRLDIGRGGLIESCSPGVRRVIRLVTEVVDETPARVLLSDRAGSVPGLADEVRNTIEADVEILERAIAARGALEYAEQLQSSSDGVEYTTRLRVTDAVRAAGPARDAVPPPGDLRRGQRATHIVYRGHAYPVTEEPLVIGTSPSPGGRTIQVGGNTAGISRSHCTVKIEGDRSVVDDHSSYGSLLNGIPLKDRSELFAGDRLLLGSPGEELLAIAAEE